MKFPLCYLNSDFLTGRYKRALIVSPVQYDKMFKKAVIYLGCFLVFMCRGGDAVAQKATDEEIH